jgi:hypothetical protein
VNALTKARIAAGDRLGRPRRWRYLEQLPKGGVGVEVGVFRGEYSRHILRVAKPRELHLVDAWWTLFGERYPAWGSYTDYGRLTTRQAYEDTVRRTRGKPVEIHVGNDLEILAGFPDGYFDWAYLDASHMYEETVAELELLRVKVRGPIMGDDWITDREHMNFGVVPAVHEFCERYGWELGPLDEMFGQWMIRPGAAT